MFRRLTFAALGLGLLALSTPSSRAGYVTVAEFTGSGLNTYNKSNNPLAASLLFEYDSTAQSLRLTLANTATSDVADPSDVLTGAFFRYGAGVNPGLTKAGTTATIAPGSDLISANKSGPLFVAPPPAGGDVTTHYAFKSGIGPVADPGLPTVPAGSMGVSATGLGGTFGTGDVLGGGPNTGGVDYGLLSAGDDLTTLNGGIRNNTPFVKNAVQFVFGGITAFDGDELNDVYFQYGTSTPEARFQGFPQGNPDPPPAVPAPAGLALVLAAAPVGLVLRRRRRA